MAAIGTTLPSNCSVFARAGAAPARRKKRGQKPTSKAAQRLNRRPRMDFIAALSVLQVFPEFGFVLRRFPLQLLVRHGAPEVKVGDVVRRFFLPLVLLVAVYFLNRKLLRAPLVPQVHLDGHVPER